MPQRKVFRIEKLHQDAVEPSQGDDGNVVPPGDDRYAELLDEIKSLRSLLETHEQTRALYESFQAQVAEAQKIKSELDLIQGAISETKREIAKVHVTGFRSADMARVAHELDAVVQGTEQATQRILTAVEDIDQCAGSLVPLLKSEQEQALAHDIQDRVVQIFEACNFQDLTGQRINKVVTTWKFIESHVARMMEIWGGIDAFRDFIPSSYEELTEEQKLLNGPKLDSDAGHASQDDIDALFN